MIRVTKLADYGVLLMTWFARSEQKHAGLKTQDPMPAVSASDLARNTGLPGPTVSKLLRQLAKGGLLQSTRGVHGGYCLARASADITVAELLEAIEGPLALTECLEEGPACGMEALCPTKANWGRINTALRDAFAKITLSEMAHDPMPNEMAMSSLDATTPGSAVAVDVGPDETGARADAAPGPTPEAP